MITSASECVLKTLPNDYFKFMTRVTAETILLNRWTRE
jgi:hypothetical protein